MKILSGSQDHSGRHNNFIFRKIIQLIVFTNFEILAFVSIDLRSTTRKQIFIYRKLFQDKKKEFLFKFEFYKIVGKSIKIRE